jgi:hypothetical protein
MSTDAQYLIKKLEEKGITLGSNTEPAVLLESGNGRADYIKLNRTKNHQVLIMIQELEQGNLIDKVERIEYNIKQQIQNCEVWPYPIEGIDNANQTIDDLSKHYAIPLRKEEIIRRMNKPGSDYFYIFLVIIESSIYS